MITTIFFDLGNVLLFFDHRIILRRIRPHAANNISFVMQRPEYGALMHSFELGEVAPENFFRSMQNLFGLKDDYSYDAFISDWSDIFWENQSLLAVLPQLGADYQLGIISNTNAMHIDFAMRKFPQVFRAMQYTVFSHECHLRKPSRDIFEFAAQRADVQPGQCFYVDDIVAYAQAAETFGFHATPFISTNGLIEVMRYEAILK